MAKPRLVLWIDSLSNRLVAGWGNPIPAANPSFKQGDNLDVTIRRIESQNYQYGAMSEIPVTGAVTVTVGNRNAKPVGGYFTLSYEDSTSDEIAHNASDCDLELVLNSMPDIALAGGVRVIRLYDDAYKIVFNNVGVRTALTGNGLLLMPQSLVNITTITLGTLTTQAVFLVLLRQDDLSEQGMWEPEAPCTASVSQINAFTWRFSLSSDPKSGQFEVAIDADPTIIIPVFASESQIGLLFGENYSVTRLGDYDWMVTSVDSNPFSLAIVEDNEIISFSGVSSTLAFTGSNITEALSSSQSIDAFIEITEEVDDVNNILLNKSCKILSKVNR